MCQMSVSEPFQNQGGGGGRNRYRGISKRRRTLVLSQGEAAKGTEGLYDRRLGRASARQALPGLHQDGSRRMFGASQKRPPQELRLAADMANRFLKQVYLPDRRFATPPEEAAFVPFATPWTTSSASMRNASSRTTTWCAARGAACRARPTAITTSRPGSGSTLTRPSPPSTAPDASPGPTDLRSKPERPRDPLRRDTAWSGQPLRA